MRPMKTSSTQQAICRYDVPRGCGRPFTAPFSSRTFALAAAYLLAVGLLAGCGRQRIDTEYGQRSGSRAGPSVNGTVVFSDMFRQAGYDVRKKSRLTPSLERFDVAVWTPDDFDVPSNEVQDHFEQWLSDGYGRTLIYVGRDYDAATGYWEKIQKDAPPEQAVEVIRRLAQAKASHDSRRVKMDTDGKCRWFKIQRDGKKKIIGGNQADPPELSGVWSANGDIDPAALAIEIEGRLSPLDKPPVSQSGGKYTTETLLAADGDAVAFRITNEHWLDGQIIVVANGSFLLNLPLVNQEHRKLAGKLIDRCGEPGRVLFLESGESGLAISQVDKQDYPTGLEMFTVWPLNFVVLHFLAVGILLILARYAIFGRPRELPESSLSDFGKHVAALGQLLERTGDHAYARSRIQYYRDHVKRDSGVSHQDK